MKNLFYKLLAPWRYYTIRESSKTLFWLNWGLPALVTIATSAVYFFYPEVIREHIFQSKDVLGFLSGFFIHFSRRLSWKTEPTTTTSHYIKI